MNLLEAAISARDNAYAPYSRYRVGASLLTDDGEMFVGCNVENASYGLTVCAERNAIAAMVASGGRKFVEIVIVTDDGKPPCGACRQTLAEFCDPKSAIVRLAAPGGVIATYTVAEMLPHTFTFEPPTR